MYVLILLYHVCKANFRAVKRRGRGRPFGENSIVTLDPNKFVEKKQHRLCFGNQQKFQPHIILNDGKILQGPSLLYDETRRIDVQTRTRHSYPPDTNAFLYYTAPSERPRIAGELRLRITSSDDPASFASGTDLLRIDGQPWSRPLIAVSKYLLLLYAKLREDRLVPDDLDSILSTFPPKKLKYSQSIVLYTLNDTFIIDLSIDTLIFSVITEQDLGTVYFRKQFVDQRDLHGAPYTGAYANHCSQIDNSDSSIGSVLARFELSTLPEHAGTRTVVLRFLKIITPVKCVIPLYDGYIRPPKEGELYQRGHTKPLCPQVWSANIDQPGHRYRCMAPGFQLLLDT